MSYRQSGCANSVTTLVVFVALMVAVLVVAAMALVRILESV